MPNQVQNELGIYAIFDKKSGKYDTPFFAMSDLFASRRFLIMQDEGKSPLAMWPEDFDLHRLGNANMDKGNLDTDHEVIIQGKPKER